MPAEQTVMTVGRLIDRLREFDEDDEVYRTAGEDPAANVGVVGVDLRRTYSFNSERKNVQVVIY